MSRRETRLVYHYEYIPEHRFACARRINVLLCVRVVGGQGKSQTRPTEPNLRSPATELSALAETATATTTFRDRLDRIQSSAKLAFVNVH